jgi:hypothetical protein
VSLVNVVLWVVGLVLIGVAWNRGRLPWSRYQALREQDANAARYNAWRGGVRDDPSATGASVAMQLLRRQALQWAGVGFVGVVVLVLGFLVK